LWRWLIPGISARHRIPLYQPVYPLHPGKKAGGLSRCVAVRPLLETCHLTPVGREIVSSARLILDEANRIRELARQTGDPMERTVQLA